MPTLSPQVTPYYGGGQVLQPADTFITSGAPSTSNINHNVGTIAVDPTASKAYMLVAKASGSATWKEITVGSGSITPVSEGGTGVSTLTGLALGSGTSAFTGVTYGAVTAWTPTIAFGGASVGVTYTSNKGYYQQIGSMVFISCDVKLSAKGSSTGAATLGGLPIATGANGVVNSIPSIYLDTFTLTASYTQVGMTFNNASSSLNFIQVGAGQTPVQLTEGAFGDTTGFFFSGVYFIN